MRNPECHRIEKKLALGLRTSDPRASLHIDRCPDCAARAEAFARVDAGLSALGAEAEDAAGKDLLHLSMVARARLLREARRAAQVAAGHGGARPAAGWLSAPSRIPAFATLLAAFLIISFAYFRTSTPVQDLSLRPAIPSGPSDLKVSQNGKDIVLEWSDGKRDTYLVRQATSAKAVYGAPGVEVRGHRYVDRSPSDAAVVYYVVE